MLFWYKLKTNFNIFYLLWRLYTVYKSITLNLKYFIVIKISNEIQPQFTQNVRNAVAALSAWEDS